uniref:Uncharacterized protein n=1 Tax=Arundo donax TaxID=35708 RepID=A0A0A9HP00_ARUDO
MPGGALHRCLGKRSPTIPSTVPPVCHRSRVPDARALPSRARATAAAAAMFLITASSSIAALMIHCPPPR